MLAHNSTHTHMAMNNDIMIEDENFLLLQGIPLILLYVILSKGWCPNFLLEKQKWKATRHFGVVVNILENMKHFLNN